MIIHFRNHCEGSSFIIELLQIFYGVRYQNNKVCPFERAKRLKRDEDMMKTYSTIYPNDLNESKKA